MTYTSIAARSNTGHGDYSLNRVMFNEVFTQPSTIKRPSQVIMESDRTRSTTIYIHHGTLSPPVTPEGVDPEAHGNKCNFTYFDGHYRAIGLGEMEWWKYNELPEWDK